MGRTSSEHGEGVLSTGECTPKTWMMASPFEKIGIKAMNIGENNINHHLEHRSTLDVQNDHRQFGFLFRLHIATGEFSAGDSERLRLGFHTDLETSCEWLPDRDRCRAALENACDVVDITDMADDQRSPPNLISEKHPHDLLVGF